MTTKDLVSYGGINDASISKHAYKHRLQEWVSYSDIVCIRFQFQKCVSFTKTK